MIDDESTPARRDGNALLAARGARDIVGETAHGVTREVTGQRGVSSVTLV